MKKIVLFFVILLTMIVMSGCVNKALVRSSQAYYDSTEPYLEMVMKNEDISAEEIDSIKLNMEQFKKTLDEFSAQESWYEF
jgi:uncharacterized protein YxeA